MKTVYLPLAARLLLVVLILIFLRPGVMDHRVTDSLRNARYYLLQGQPEHAQEQLKFLQGIENWRSLPQAELAKLYLDLGKPSEAIAILESISRETTLSLAGWMTLAAGYEQIEHPSQMEEALLNAIEIQSTGDETIAAYQKLVNLYRQQNRFSEALQMQTRLVELRPADKEFLYEKILLEIALDPQKGLRENEQIIGKPAWLVQVERQIAADFDEEDEVVQAVKIGRAFGAIGSWDLAEYWFQQGVNISPRYAEAWAFLSEARQQRGLDGKEQTLRALELAPDSTGVRALAAVYFRRQQEPAKAISLLEQNISSEPAESTWYLELGSVLAETGKMELAVNAYQKAIELAPSDYTKYTALARLCVQYEYRIEDLALPAAERALVLAEKNPETQDAYGLVLMAAGEIEKANQAFSIALSLDPDHSPTWLHVGQSAISSGDFPLAQEALKNVTRIAPNSPEGQIARRLLEQYF